MIKRIRSEELKPGMFIHDLNCGWMDHPFMLNSVNVSDEKTIAEIISCGIRELYIDTSKGLDVTDAPTQDEFNAEIHDQITSVVESYANKPVNNIVPLNEEIVQVKALRNEAHQIVHNFMSDARLGKQIKVEEMAPVVEHVFDSIIRNQDAFVSLSRIKHKDEYTYQHSLSVCVLMVTFSRAMGYEKDVILEAGIGGLLHDVGKMKVPDRILNKPGALTEPELTTMKSHAAIGRELLKQTPGVPETAIVITGQHHERYDGTGYPDHIKRDEISQLGQMASIVDVYDALTSNRIYHIGMEPTAVLKKLFEWSKFHFNPHLVERFICMIGIYPVGSLVRLESGMLGIVVDPGQESLLRPIVRVVFDTRRDFAVAPHDIDLSIQSDDSIVGHESPQRWDIYPFSYLNAT
jgi:putative nucleotidyltransferase with HDIG domain